MTTPQFLDTEDDFWTSTLNYELSHKEKSKASKMSWDELLENNICPECLHKMRNEKCLLHGTKAQINLYKPIEKKRKSKKK